MSDGADGSGPGGEESGESLRSVLFALGANLTLATAKGVAAALTGSSALFAETLHTLADAGNEVLLWIAIRRSARPADATHPFGYGPERWFYALLAAVGMFVIGGAVSIYDGVKALLEPVELEAFWVGVVVLVAALVLDGSSRLVASRNLRRQAGRRGLSVRTMLRESADPTLTTVYLEDTVDVAGAALALLALVLHRVTGDAIYDAAATILIGLLLILVAVGLTRRNLQLLSNQSVPERYVAKLRERLQARVEILSVPSLEAVYLGPGEVLVAADVVVRPEAPVAACLRDLCEELLSEIPAIARVHLTPVVPASAGDGVSTLDTPGTSRP